MRSKQFPNRFRTGVVVGDRGSVLRFSFERLQPGAERKFHTRGGFARRPSRLQGGVDALRQLVAAVAGDLGCSIGHGMVPEAVQDRGDVGFDVQARRRFEVRQDFAIERLQHEGAQFGIVHGLMDGLVALQEPEVGQQAVA